MKKLSQSSIGSLKVPRMRGRSGSPEWRGGKFLGFFTSVAAEKRVQQVDHRPQMAAFLDIDLEQVAQIVERRAAQAEQALLLDRSGLGVALGHDQPAQGRTVLARDLLPRLLANGVAA